MLTIQCDTLQQAIKTVKDYGLIYDTTDYDSGLYNGDINYVWWKSYPGVQPKYKVAHYTSKEKKLYIYEEDV